MTEYIMDRRYDIANGTFSTVKREEIIRCRDCAKYEPSTIDEDGEGDPSWCWKWEREWVAEDGYCSWGVRRQTHGNDR